MVIVVVVTGDYKNMRLLFVSRNFPPTIGGLEKYSYELYANLKQVLPDVSLIANRHHLKGLPWFFIRVLTCIFFKSRSFTNIHLADGSLSILIPCLKIFAPQVKVTISVHGLDVTYGNFFYQNIIPSLIAKADSVICVSANTMKECCERGVPREKCHVIPNGIEFDGADIRKISLIQIERMFNLRISGSRIIFSIGRLVKRKGIVWFIENVMAKLDNGLIYLIAGSGIEDTEILDTIKKYSLEQSVFFLGEVTEKQKDLLFRTADFFIMPNIKIKNDVEGFGLTVLEAGTYGVTVIASAIDGLVDSVVAGKTGFLVCDQDGRGFVDRLNGDPLDRAEVRKEAAKQFAWKRVVLLYRDIFLSSC